MAWPPRLSCSLLSTSTHFIALSITIPTYLSLYAEHCRSLSITLIYQNNRPFYQRSSLKQNTKWSYHSSNCTLKCALRFVVTVSSNLRYSPYISFFFFFFHASHLNMMASTSLLITYLWSLQQWAGQLFVLGQPWSWTAWASGSAYTDRSTV